MPSNLLHTSFHCPICGSLHHDEAWEFLYGALAGEDYFLGDQIRFSESFSFFAQHIGHPEERVEVSARGQCPSEALPLLATLIIDHGVLIELIAPRPIDPDPSGD